MGLSFNESKKTKKDAYMKSKFKIKNLIPSGITALRIILTPFFFLAVINDFFLYSIGIFVFAVATDAIDGYFARQLGLTSLNGVYFDVTADFILILAGFSAIVIKGSYPFWILLVIIFMFLQFIITSKSKISIYDPIGKYYGSFLFLTIFICLIANNPYLNSLLTILIVVFTFISITSRLIFMLKHN